MTRDDQHQENKTLLIETSTNVKWIKEQMEKELAAQRLFNSDTTKAIDSVKARVWQITGGLLAAQALIVAFLGFKK